MTAEYTERKEQIEPRKLTIAVVDDHTPTLTTYGMILRDEGHTVLLYANAEEALEDWKDDFQGVDMVISDHGMTGLNGTEFAKSLREKSFLGVIAIFSCAVSSMNSSEIDQLLVYADIVGDKPIMILPDNLLPLCDEIGRFGGERLNKEERFNSWDTRPYFRKT